MKLAVAFAFCVAVIATQTSGAQPVDWPKLREFTKEFDIDLRAPKTLVDVKLLDVAGKPTYRLVCFAGNQQANTDGGGFIYTGGLQCGLGLIGTPIPFILENRSLLAGNVAAYYSRGTFHAEELMGECVKHPEYGAVRNFRLRRFELELRLEDLHFVPTNRTENAADWEEARAANANRDWYPLGRAKLAVRVSSDSRATGPDVKLTGPYPFPGGAYAACAGDD